MHELADGPVNHVNSDYMDQLKLQLLTHTYSHPLWSYVWELIGPITTFYNRLLSQHYGLINIV